MLPLAATVNLAYGLAPSLFVKAPEELVLPAEKLYRVVKVCAVARPVSIKPNATMSMESGHELATTPLGLRDWMVDSPRVARSSQPRALGWNPLGIRGR